ncbi:choice-of-anchor C family protein [Lewinella sp. 4G2]|uniref:choice-of-anchor C family protein n=1 Tax=Lewinella sp. 4G2 TaxID=1803372 RepID=UPI0007B483E1|nr:choice-of-anchor C family protein [Lewinella sp. 4G2]OAV43772.1 hypothetical protein A3850_004345 [Lewinella sp. 4G2]
MQSVRSFLTWLMILFCTCGQAQEIVNGSFERGDANPSVSSVNILEGDGRIDGWEVTQNLDYVGGSWAAADGERSIDLNGSLPGTISQRIPTIPGRNYIILFDLAGNIICGPNVKFLRVSAAETEARYQFDINGKSASTMGWRTERFEFQAVADTTVLAFASDMSGICGPALDNVRRIDCNGILNGRATRDSCNLCLTPEDPTFNACLDCAGRPNGASIIDDCGQCASPSSPTFNACFDCFGVQDGGATFDSCGVCRNPSDPAFSRFCDAGKVFAPTAFSPNGDGINDVFKVYTSTLEDAQISYYAIYDRWGALIYRNQNIAFESEEQWWNGRVDDQPAPAGLYVYVIEAIFRSDPPITLRGHVALVR